MGQNDNTGIVIVAICAVLIFVLYFLSKVFLTLGFLLIGVSIILLIIGVSQGNNLTIIGIFLLLLGIILAGVGHEGVTFFEQNPTGKNLLDTANTVVNTTKEATETYGEISKIKTQVLQNVTNNTT